MRFRSTAVFAAIAWLAFAGPVAATQAPAKPRQYQPRIDPSDFVTVIDNPYFPVEPGTVWKYVEKKGKRESSIEVTATSEKRTVMGVECVVVRDVERINGEVAEETEDWYAQDKGGNVWYFGEDTKEYHHGRVDTGGSWEAGVDGALPGILMKAVPEVGEPYRQEYCPGRAEDMGQVTALSEEVTVPHGTFKSCLRTKDWSPLEHGSEKKWYAKGVGLVRAESTGGEVTTLVSTTAR